MFADAVAQNGTCHTGVAQGHDHIAVEWGHTVRLPRGAFYPVIRYDGRPPWL